MKRLWIFFVGILCLACSREPAPLSSETVSRSSATSALDASRAQSVVVQTDEYDTNLDGTFDHRNVTTTSYDVHGNAVGVVYESFQGSARVYRDVTTNEYNNHGDLIGYVYDIDNRGDGTVDIRDLMTTLETDQQGHPLRQKLAEDVGADGTFDFSFEWSNRFDARGRLVVRDTGQQTDRYQYDQHDNVVRHEMHWAVNNRIIDEILAAEWTVHGSELRSASTVTQTGQPQTGHTLTSVTFDRQGYPTVQILERTSGGLLTSHATIGISYDGHHRVLVRQFSDDTDLDGQPDYGLTSRYDYAGLEVAAAPGRAVGRPGIRAGAAPAGADPGQTRSRDILEH